MAARVVFAPLFFSFHHPKYQQLHMRDLCQCAQIPLELLSYINANESFSLFGRQNAGQGGDFCHEELNKRIKANLPPVMPSFDVWTRICRKLEDLEEIRNSLLASTESKSNFRNHDQEVTMMRREIRSKSTIFHDPLLKYAPVKALNGSLLSNDLVDVKYQANENYKNYKEHFLENDTSYEAKIKSPIFVTEQERIEFNKIDNKKKSEVHEILLQMIETIQNKDVKKAKQNYLQSNEKKFKHKQFVDFYYEVKDVIDEENMIDGYEIEEDESNE